MILIFYILVSGKSLSYIFTLGSSGMIDISNMNDILRFVSNFSNCLIVPWLYIITKSKNMIKKFLITLLTMHLYLLN